MRNIRTSLAFAVIAAAAACSHSPTSPSSSSQSGVLQGQAVNAIDSSAEAGLSVQIGKAQPVTSDANGDFQTSVSEQGTYVTSIQGTAVVDRLTPLNGPTADRIRVSVIPATFDLQAFDEMFRTTNARLQRWVTQPSVIIIATSMEFNSGSSTYTVINDRMTDDEVAGLEQNLAEGLSLLTGGTYTSFASVTVERPSPGDEETVARDGKIVVGRYTGVVGLRDTIGFGNWQEQPDGRITGGTIYLDRDFDRDNSQRRLLRIHELGHALGYQHVTTTTSIMNPAIGPQPTEFDRSGAIIAFQRPPGNVSPDTDPGTSTPRPFSVGGGRWSKLVP